MESSWLPWIPIISLVSAICPCLPLCHLPFSLHLSPCPLLPLAMAVMGFLGGSVCAHICVHVFTCALGRMCTHTHTHTHTHTQRNMAEEITRAVHTGTKEQQYSSSWWELRGCGRASAQPCVNMKEGWSTERELRGKEMQRPAEGGRSSFRWKAWGRWEPCLFFICLRDRTHRDIQGVDDQNRNIFKVHLRICRRLIFHG